MLSDAPAPPPPPPIVEKNEKELVKKGFSNEIVWARTIESCSLSEDGSGGVVFVDFKGEEYPPVVVKGSSTVVQEIFALELASIMNIQAPKYYIVDFTQREFRQIQTNLRNGVGARSSKVEKELNRPFLMVMERVPGKDIFRVVQAKGPEKVPEMVSEYLGNEHILYEIGRIMVLDVLLNNLDRLPLVWDNEGNLENILFSDTPEGPVFAIDQAIYPVSKKLQLNYDKYLQKVKNLVEDLSAENWTLKEGSPIAKVRDSFKVWTNFDMNETHTQAMRRGILQAICDITENLTPETVPDLKVKIAKIATVDWQNVFHDGLKAVQLEFVKDIVKIFHQYSQPLKLALNSIASNI